jgi:hypothetical protein
VTTSFESTSKRNANPKKGDLHHSVNFARLVPYFRKGTNCHADLRRVGRTRETLLPYSRIATSREVATDLWQMAREYQAQAAELGAFPERSRGAAR